MTSHSTWVITLFSVCSAVIDLMFPFALGALKLWLVLWQWHLSLRTLTHRYVYDTDSTVFIAISSCNKMFSHAYYVFSLLFFYSLARNLAKMAAVIVSRQSQIISLLCPSPWRNPFLPLAPTTSQTTLAGRHRPLKRRPAPPSR